MTRPDHVRYSNCERCFTPFVARSGNANRFCSQMCVKIAIRDVHSGKLIPEAKKLWSDGLSVSQIAAAIGVKKGVISGITHRNRDVFPRRPSIFQ